MLKNFRRTSQPTKIFLHRNFISNAFTCENLLSVFVQICFSAAAIALSTFNESFEGFFVFTLGVGLIIPFAYITVLSVHKILPKVCISYIKECAMNHLCCQIWYFWRGARDNHPSLEDSVEHERSLVLHQENVMRQQPTYWWPHAMHNKSVHILYATFI